jgi:hypothetical protein
MLRGNRWSKAMSVVHMLKPAKIIDLNAVYLLPIAVINVIAAVESHADIVVQGRALRVEQ